MDVMFNKSGKYRINRDLIEVSEDDIISKKVFQIHDDIAKEYINVGHVIAVVKNFVIKEVKSVEQVIETKVKEVEEIVKKEEAVITTKIQSKKGK